MNMKITINVAIPIILIFLVIVLFYFVIGRFVTGSDNYCNETIGKEKVIFAYSDGCPHCRAMEPIMQNRTDVYWLNLGSSKCISIAQDLKISVASIPTFICTKNVSISTVGQRSAEEINSWIDQNC